jgi:hypothetical protein
MRIDFQQTTIMLKKLTRQCRKQTQTQKLEAVCTVRDS